MDVDHNFNNHFSIGHPRIANQLLSFCANPDRKLEPTSGIMPEGLPSGIILEVGSSLLTQVYNTYNNLDNNHSNPLKLNVFLSNQTP